MHSFGCITSTCITFLDDRLLNHLEKTSDQKTIKLLIGFLARLVPGFLAASIKLNSKKYRENAYIHVGYHTNILKTENVHGAYYEFITSSIHIQ